MIVQATAEFIADAGARLKTGGLVAFPTETVYGLGADATSDTAVARIFAAKNRPGFNPLIVHVPDVDRAASLVQFTDLGRKIADAFWPGPLSIVLRRTDNCPISLLASAGLETIAIRVPAQTTAQAILQAAGVPVAAPSANASGKISPTEAAHVHASLGDAVDLIVDDGPCRVGLESTVIDCTTDRPVVLRPGGITTEQIEAIAGPVDRSDASPDRPASPGMLQSHYAPDAAIRLNVSSVEAGEGLLAFGRHRFSGVEIERNLSPSADLQEAAANLFAMLRQLDAVAERIAVMPIPGTGLGQAINDRLQRAAAPRH
ncbi:MAG: L-threonylcarbamoyladenylate synthase [Alphaproteobacteria bacterium]